MSVCCLEASGVLPMSAGCLEASRVLPMSAGCLEASGVLPMSVEVVCFSDTNFFSADTIIPGRATLPTLENGFTFGPGGVALTTSSLVSPMPCFNLGSSPFSLATPPLTTPSLY